MSEMTPRREKYLEMIRKNIEPEIDPEVEELYHEDESETQAEPEHDEKDFIRKMLTRGFRS